MNISYEHSKVFNKHRSEATCKITWKSDQNVARTNHLKFYLSNECAALRCSHIRASIFMSYRYSKKCTCSSSFLQWPNLSINTLWPRLTCSSNLFLNILTFWRALVFNNKMPFYKHCSNFRDLVNYPIPYERSGYLEQFWTALVWTLANGSNQISKWTGPKFIRSRVNGA